MMAKMTEGQIRAIGRAALDVLAEDVERGRVSGGEMISLPKVVSDVLMNAYIEAGLSLVYKVYDGETTKDMKESGKDSYKNRRRMLRQFGYDSSVIDLEYTEITGEKLDG